MTKDIHILVFGTSVTWGAWDKEGGWVARLKKFFDEKTLRNPDFFCLVYNLGVSGNTTEHILKRFKFETEQRMSEKPEEVIFIFDFGGNDAAFIYSKKGLWVPSERFKENTEKLIELAQEYSSKIIFVGLHPVDDKKTNPVPWAPDIFYKNENAKEYNEILNSICREKNLLFVNIIDLLNSDDLEDGLHPNSEGHKKIFEAVKDFLIQNKII